MTDPQRCPYCQCYMRVLGYMRHAGLRPGHLPAVIDDQSWEQLREDHAPKCYWWHSRGERQLTLAALSDKSANGAGGGT